MNAPKFFVKMLMCKNFASGTSLTYIFKFSTNNATNFAFDEVWVKIEYYKTQKTTQHHTPQYTPKPYTTHRNHITHIKNTHHTLKPHIIRQNYSPYITHQQPHHTPKPHTVHQNHSPYYAATRHTIQTKMTVEINLIIQNKASLIRLF